MATATKLSKKKTARRVMKSSARKSTTRSRATKRVSRKRVASPNGKHAATKNVKPLVSQKELLQLERVQVENDLATFRAELSEAHETTGDEVDLNVYERERTLGLVAQYERRLKEIDATLKVAAQGKYGICERCGKAIDPERLQIFPETRLCVSCKNEMEREQRRLRI